MVAYYATKSNEINTDKIIEWYMENERKREKEEAERQERLQLKRLKEKYK